MLTDVKEKIDVQWVNDYAKRDMNLLIAESESRYRSQIETVAEHFCASLPQNRIILLAGPSSSGKTTTSYNLQRELLRRGVKTLPISLDDFFRSNQLAPVMPDGSLNLEVPELVDREYLQVCLQKLQTEGCCNFPMYDFTQGERKPDTYPLTMDEHTAIIIEGLHALNPMVADLEPFQNALKLYISIKSEFYLDGVKVLNTRNLRLIRRLIRDYNFRDCMPRRTLEMWKNVVDGESSYIRPYRMHADFWIDSLHLYEPIAYHSFFIELIKKIENVSGYEKLIEKLTQGMDCFGTMNLSQIPKDSLLREFIILP